MPFASKRQDDFNYYLQQLRLCFVKSRVVVFLVSESVPQLHPEFSEHIVALVRPILAEEPDFLSTVNLVTLWRVTTLLFHELRVRYVFLDLSNELVPEL